MRVAVVIIGCLSSSFGLSSFEKRIYIPLPGPEARRRMFELHVGDTPCELSPKDYRLLADKTDGYVLGRFVRWFHVLIV